MKTLNFSSPRALQILGGTSFAQELIELYLKTTPLIVEKLLQAEVAGKYELVETQIHQLRAASQHIGASDLLENLEKVEVCAANQERLRLSAEVKVMVSLYSRVLIDLKNMASDLSSLKMG